jgi:hypothetical protein
MAYGQTDVNSGARGGEFLTGNLNFFQIATAVPCYPTNVKTPYATAIKARNWTSLSGSRTITVVDGNGAEVTYSAQSAYEDAYYTQKNLDTLLNVFSTRANPVVVSVSSTTIDNDPATTILAGAVNGTQFGSTYTVNSLTVYNINLVTERNPAWLVNDSTAPQTNTNGYQFLSTLDGTPTLATTAIAATSFVVDGSAAGRNVIAKVRNEL